MEEEIVGENDEFEFSDVNSIFTREIASLFDGIENNLCMNLIICNLEY